MECKRLSATSYQLFHYTFRFVLFFETNIYTSCIEHSCCVEDSWSKAEPLKRSAEGAAASKTPAAKRDGETTGNRPVRRRRSDCVAPCPRSALSAKRPARKGKGTEKRLATSLIGGNNLEWKRLSTTSYELPTTDYHLPAIRTLRLPCLILP